MRPDNNDFKIHTYRLLLCILLYTLPINSISANDMGAGMVIDDRSNAGNVSNLGTEWRLVTDGVMGGLSAGRLTVDTHKDRDCLRLQGDVTTENNGGFVQIALELSEQGIFDASDYTGVEIEVAGNDEAYNIHFRTDDLWFPWQSYRYTFTATDDWQNIRIPFTALEKYRTFHDFSTDEITRVGLVAIGRDFQADLCLASISFYHE